MGRRNGRRGRDGRTVAAVPRPRARRRGGRDGHPGVAGAVGGGGGDGARDGVLRPPALCRAREGERRMNREPLRPVLYDEAADAVRVLDQTKLPGEEVWLSLRSADE